jgi:Fe-S-cluster containining protein
MTDERLTALLDIYRRIPRVACRRRCQQACGAVFDDGAVSQQEADRVFAFPGYRPPVERTCGYLDARGLCSIYDRRPLICRLWGTVDMGTMRCSEGCEPERWLTDEEARAMVDEAKAIGGGMFAGTPLGIQNVLDDLVNGMMMMAREGR